MIKEILIGLHYFLLNSIINKLPFYSVRNFIYKYFFQLSVCSRVCIQSNVRMLMPNNIYIGCNSIINNRVFLDGRGAKLTIGSYVDIAPEVNIWTTEHVAGCKLHSVRSEPVIIEDYVWLCNRVTILPGSIIRTGCVVGAGAVVKGVLEAGWLYAGVPAKKIRKLDTHKGPVDNTYFPWFM